MKVSQANGRIRKNFSKIETSINIPNLIDIQKGWRAIEASSIPKTEYVCPTKLSQEVIDQAVADVV